MTYNVVFSVSGRGTNSGNVLSLTLGSDTTSFTVTVTAVDSVYSQESNSVVYTFNPY
jgi:hypothetical protein